MSKLTFTEATKLEFAQLGPSDARWREALTHAPHDLYHRPEYVALEAERTGSWPAAGYVRWESGALLVPFLARGPDESFGAFDAASPYDYSGALFVVQSDGETRRAAVARLWHGMRELGYCSVFLRMHPLLDGANDAFSGGSLHRTGSTVVVDLARSPDELWQGMKKSVRRVIRRSEEAGMTTSLLSPAGGPLEEFTSLYHETMRHVGAAPGYFTFDLDYFLKLEAALGEYLSLVLVTLDGSTLCASLNSRCGAIAQSMLAGTRTAARPLQPSVLEVYEMMLHYREAGARYLNLGGGLGGQQDSLFRFKQAFSRETRPFYSVRVVLDEAAYAALVAERARASGVTEAQLLGSGFFPAYRAPA